LAKFRNDLPREGKPHTQLMLGRVDTEMPITPAMAQPDILPLAGSAMFPGQQMLNCRAAPDRHGMEAHPMPASPAIVAVACP
jgi:hypothetical protein